MSDRPVIDRATYDAFQEDLRQLARSPLSIQLEVPILDAWLLIGTLQLALRHPDHRGVAAVVARHIKDTLVKLVATTPALATVAAAGDDPAYDGFDPTAVQH